MDYTAETYDEVVRFRVFRGQRYILYDEVDLALQKRRVAQREGFLNGINNEGDPVEVLDAKQALDALAGPDREAKLALITQHDLIRIQRRANAEAFRDAEQRVYDEMCDVVDGKVNMPGEELVERYVFQEYLHEDVVDADERYTEIFPDTNERMVNIAKRDLDLFRKSLKGKRSGPRETDQVIPYTPEKPARLPGRLGQVLIARMKHRNDMDVSLLQYFRNGGNDDSAGAGS